MICLRTSKPTAPSIAARTALRSGVCWRGSRAITHRKTAKSAVSAEQDAEHAQQHLGPALVGQPDQVQKVARRTPTPAR